jgi:hypothetical protein
MGQTRTSGYTRGGTRCLWGVVSPVDRLHSSWAQLPDQVNDTYRSHTVSSLQNLLMYMKNYGQKKCEPVRIWIFIFAGFRSNLMKWKRFFMPRRWDCLIHSIHYDMWTIIVMANDAMGRDKICGIFYAIVAQKMRRVIILLKEIFLFWFVMIILVANCERTGVCTVYFSLLQICPKVLC